MTLQRSSPQRLLIEGAGPVAMALRLFLARQGFGADAVQHAAFARPLPGWLASRPLAISRGSWQLLSRIVTLPQAAPIRSIEVSIAAHAGRTCFHARDFARDLAHDLETARAESGHAPALGHVLRYGALHASLAEALARIGERDSSASAANANAAHANTATNAADASVTNGRNDAALVVVADGEPRAQGGSRNDWRVLDFGQAALLAEIVAERDAEGVAFERFTREGPLALLPLPEPRRHALVWCAGHARTAQRAAMPESGFDAQLREIFGPALGVLHVEGPRHQAPLQRTIGAHGRDPRRLAIGNASQSLHPVAGQGFNLGLRDAFELAQCLGDARSAGERLESAARRFRRSRTVDRAFTIGVTDLLAQLFTIGPLAPIESAALGALDLVAPLRNRFANTLMFGLR